MLRGVGGAITQSSTFAGLPSAGTVQTNQLFFVSDVGVNGSYWYSDGTRWNPVNGEITLFNFPLPIGIAPSGSLAVTSGVVTLGTALNQIYPQCFLWFPANTWTNSVAGMYPVAMTSTTSGTVYSNICTSGVPVWPASPTLVTTGAGAYTQTTGVNLNLASIALPGNIMGNNGKLTAEYGFVTDTTTGLKVFYPLPPFVAGSGNIYANSATLIAQASSVWVQNQNSASVQLAPSQPAFYGASGAFTGSTVNTASSVAITPQGKLSSADSDWLMLVSYQIKLAR